MKNKHGVLVFVMALAVSFLTMTGSVKAITIDSFDLTSQSITAGSGGSVSSTVVAPEAIGSSRTLEILSVTGPSSVTLDVITGGFGLLTLNNPALTSSTARVTWDANGAGLGGGLGMDLTGSGAFDSIGLDLVLIDQGNVSLTVSIFEIGGDSAFLLLPSAVLGQNVFKFDTFTNFATVSFDLVSKITLDIAAGNASDLGLDFFETLENPVIPEPATIGLLGIGLAGLGSVYLRRRFRQPKKTTV